MEANFISVGELRQNPTRMLRAVKRGATYTVTDHGDPVAEIAPRRVQRWVSAEQVDALLRELGGDETWKREIDGDRSRTEMADPWEQAE